MSIRLTLDRTLRVAACLGAILAAGCGGGGGGAAPPPPPQLLQITALNQDAVTRATVATFFSMTGVSAVPSPAPARPATAAGIADFTVRALGKAVVPGSSDSKLRALAISSTTELCSVSGSITITVDDRDNNGMPSPGDVVTIAFDNCRTSATSLTNGRLVLALSGVAGTPTSTQLSGTFTYDQLTFIEDGFTSAVNGVTSAVYTESIDPTSTITIRLDSTVAAGGLVGSGSAAGFSDTFSYDAGFNSVMIDTLPPMALSSSTMALNGTVHVASLGGRIAIVTNAPVHIWENQPYPDSGQVTVQGDGSRLRLTVMNTVTVRSELDSNNDGTYESTHDLLWTNLMP